MILDGKKASEDLFHNLLPHTQSTKPLPLLAAVQVGDNPASSTYIKLKAKTLSKLSLGFRHIHLASSCTKEEVAQAIESLNNDPEVTGVLLQLPLPSHLDSDELLNLIHPLKDPDCLTTENLGKFFADQSPILPATPLGVIRLLEYYKIELEGKNVCIVGRSNLVGKPLAIALTQRNATVTICHSKTKDLESHTQNADLVILAVGKPRYFGAEFFTKQQTVIDVGISRDEKGQLCGDVDFDNVSKIVKNITPVPGGVGPMTIYGLMENLITLAKAY